MSGVRWALALPLAAVLVALAPGAVVPDEVAAVRRAARQWVGAARAASSAAPARAASPVAMPLTVRVSPLATAAFVPAALLVRGQAESTAGLFPLTSLLVGALGFVLLGLWLDRFLLGLRVPDGTALVVTMAALLGSPLLYYGRIGDGTVWAAAGLVLALDGLHRQRRGAFAIGGALFVLGRPELWPLGLFLIVRALVTPRLRHVGALVVPLGALALAIGLGFRDTVGSVPLTTGLYGLLLSTGKSIFLYAPWLALAILGWRAFTAHEEDLARDVALLGILGALVVGARADWHGDPSWGPRLFVVFVPAFALALAYRSTRFIPLLGALGFVVQLPGLLIPARAYASLIGDVRVATGGSGWFSQVAADQQFIPQLSPLVGHSWLLWHRLLRTVQLPPAPWRLIYQPPPPSVVPQPTLDGRWALIGIDWWGILAARWVVAGVLVGCVLIGALGLIALHKRKRD